jgi:hypothetical protein
VIDNRLRLDDIGAPLAVLDDRARVLDATPSAAALITRSIAGLLDFVRLGQPVCATQSLRETVDPVSSLLRPVFRAGQHELVTELHGCAMAVVRPVARTEDLE